MISRMSSASSEAASAAAALMKHRYLESRQQRHNLKAMVREQKERSRQIVVACAVKMQEQEKEIDRVSFNKKGEGAFKKTMTKKCRLKSHYPHEMDI